MYSPCRQPLSQWWRDDVSFPMDCLSCGVRHKFVSPTFLTFWVPVSHVYNIISKVKGWHCGTACLTTTCDVSAHLNFGSSPRCSTLDSTLNTCSWESRRCPLWPITDVGEVDRFPNSQCQPDPTLAFVTIEILNQQMKDQVKITNYKYYFVHTKGLAYWNIEIYV